MEMVPPSSHGAEPDATTAYYGSPEEQEGMYLKTHRNLLKAISMSLFVA